RSFARRDPYVGVESVAHDREEPRLQAGAELETIDVCQTLDQGLLHQVVGFVLVAVERAGECLERRNQAHQFCVRTSILAMRVVPRRRHWKSFKKAYLPHRLNALSHTEVPTQDLASRSRTVTSWRPSRIRVERRSLFAFYELVE